MHVLAFFFFYIHRTDNFFWNRSFAWRKQLTHFNSMSWSKFKFETWWFICKVIWNSTLSRETYRGQGIDGWTVCPKLKFYFILYFFILFQSFGDGVLPSVKSLLHSRKELCNVSTDECLNREGQDNFIEVWHNLTIYIYFVGLIENGLACSSMGSCRIVNLNTAASYWL